MALAHEKLRSLELPPYTETRTKRDAALYALSVGLGVDPMDESQLKFVDFTRNLVALPSMATILAAPRSPLADPAYGADYTKAVNGEASVILHRPIPIEGELTGTSRITAIVDKGLNRGALVYMERIVRDAAGVKIATVGSTTFLRGDGGCGSPDGAAREARPLPASSPGYRVDLPTRPEQALYYRFNGDENPLHADPAAATLAGFPRPILHGLCTFGVVCHALIRELCAYDPARLHAFEMRFSAPVFPGETIRTEMWDDGSFRARVLERDVIVVSNGRAQVTG